MILTYDFLYTQEETEIVSEFVVSGTELMHKTCGVMLHQNIVMMPYVQRLEHVMILSDTIQF